MQEGKEVTCILTSCGRFDLLERTLESFFKFNTYDVKEFIIYEDSGYKMVGRDEWPFIKWIYNTGGKNQITALDTLWSMVKTPYAFTMEDDWETIAPGFIERSIEVLEKYPDILQVWLHELEPNNVHPIHWPLDKDFGLLKTDGNLWSGIRFAPAVKRKKDYELIAPFSSHTTFDPAKPWKAEAAIAQVYHKLGFKAAKFNETYIVHLGQNRHVS